LSESNLIQPQDVDERLILLMASFASCF